MLAQNVARDRRRKITESSSVVIYSIFTFLVIPRKKEHHILTLNFGQIWLAYNALGRSFYFQKANINF
jgi:hypothetical protein